MQRITHSAHFTCINFLCVHRTTSPENSHQFPSEDQINGLTVPARLDLVFLFRCMHGLVKLNISNFVSFNQGRTRRSTAGVYFKTPRTRTSCFRDSYFNRIVNLWNSLPDIVKNCTTVSGFKNQLKKFYFSRLFRVFDADNIRSYKIVCPKCRRINPLNVCSC